MMRNRRFAEETDTGTEPVHQVAVVAAVPVRDRRTMRDGRHRCQGGSSRRMAWGRGAFTPRPHRLGINHPSRRVFLDMKNTAV